jgi:hypothetical protein
VVRAAKRSAAELGAELARVSGILRSEQIAPIRLVPDTVRNELVVGIYKPASGSTVYEGGSPDAIQERVTTILREANSFAIVEMLDHGPPRAWGSVRLSNAIPATAAACSSRRGLAGEFDPSAHCEHLIEPAFWGGLS